jgi:hypothetical protein
MCPCRRSRSRAVVAVGLATALSLGPATARAQAAAAPAAHASPTDDAVAQASEHYGRGVRLYQEEDYAAAVIEFNRAYELAPNFAVLYNIGQSYYSLRDYAAALTALERYEREGGAQVPAERRPQLEREIRELRGRVAHVTLVTSVPGADVTLDDAPLAGGSEGEPRLVGAGRHRFAASKPGFVTAARVVDVAGGDTLTVRLELLSESSGASTPAPVRERSNYTGAVVTGIAGVAGVAVGAVFGVLTLNGKATLDGECSGAKVCPSRAQSDIDAYARNGTIAGVGFGVGVVGLGLGAYFFFHERGKEAASTQARLAPWIGPGGAGVVGAF